MTCEWCQGSQSQQKQCHFELYTFILTINIQTIGYGHISLTLCLDSKLGEKRKEGKGARRREHLVCLEWKGKGWKMNPPFLLSKKEILSSFRIYPLISPSFLAIQTKCKCLSKQLFQ